jgi:lipopolysaccharide transport system permease protein
LPTTLSTRKELESKAPELSEPLRSERIFRIQSHKGWVALQLKELWDYRELLYFLIWRDVRVRYKQTALGAAWAILQPLFTMVIFSVIGSLANIASDGVPRPLFNLAALVPWTFFAHGLAQGSDSLVGSANLIRKVYFPRLMIPMATVMAGLVDFSIAFGLLLCMMTFYGVHASFLQALFVIPMLLLALVMSLGVGFWLSALNVKFRDVKYTLPFLTQFWCYATPILWPSSLLKEPWHTLYGLNPMAGVVEGFRWALLGTNNPPGPMVAVSAVVALAVLASGAFYFRRMEKTFADTV